MLFVFSNPLYASGIKQKISLGPEATSTLTQIYSDLEKLRSEMYKSNEVQVNSQLGILKLALEKGIEGTKKEAINGQHINRLLLATIDHISTAQNTQGEQRLKNLKDAFKQLVILYESYKIENNLKVYWCYIDRAVWLQKQGKIENPFEPKTNCGRPTR